MPGFDLKQVNRNDQVVMGAGALAFILSFFPDYAITANSLLGHGSAHYNGWQGIGILSILLFMAAGGIVALRLFTQVRLPKLPLGWNVIVAGAAALGTVFLLLEGFVLFDPYGVSGVPGVSTGFAWGGYILLILGIAQTAFAFFTMKESGEKLQWDATALNRPAQPSGDPGAQQMPPAPYQQPYQPAPPQMPEQPQGQSDSAAPAPPTS